MNESETGRTYVSIDEALEVRQMPMENRDFVRRMVTEIGIAALLDRGTYLRADRIDAGPALNIEYGFTNGFVSEDEARRICGGRTDHWPSSRAQGLWGVSHPEHKMRNGGGEQARVQERDYGTCPSCYMALPATGRCDDCD